MNLLILVVEILLSFLLFIIMNTLEEKNLNRIDTILIPNISMILISSIFTKLKNYMILFIIFYLVIDFIYVFLVSKKDLLISKKNYYINSLITLLLGIIIYNYFLLKVKYSYVDMEVFKNFIWVIIILYFYNKLNLKTFKLEKEEKDNYNNYYKEFVVINYARFKNKYSYLIKTNENIENILYSFMIYETYKKNKNIISLVKEKINNKNRYGIMNIESDHKLSDEESIVIIKENLEAKLKRIKNKNEITEKLIKDKYSRDYKEIIEILNIIKEFKKNN